MESFVSGFDMDLEGKDTQRLDEEKRNGLNIDDVDFSKLYKESS